LVNTQQLKTATLENIDSFLILAKAQHSRSKTYRKAYGSKSTLHQLNSAIIELEMVEKKKQELIAKKKLVI